MEIIIDLILLLPMALFRAYIFLQLYDWFGKSIYDLRIGIIQAAGLLLLITFTTLKQVDLKTKTTEEKIEQYIAMVIFPLTFWGFGWVLHILM